MPSKTELSLVQSTQPEYKRGETRMPWNQQAHYQEPHCNSNGPQPGAPSRGPRAPEPPGLWQRSEGTRINAHFFLSKDHSFCQGFVQFQCSMLASMRKRTYTRMLAEALGFQCSRAAVTAWVSTDSWAGWAHYGLHTMKYYGY